MVTGARGTQNCTAKAAEIGTVITALQLEVLLELCTE